MSQGFFQTHERLTAARASAPAAAAAAAPPMTVTAVTSLIDRALKSGLPAQLRVQGEVSNANLHRASGHLYFTLKDGGSCLEGMMFKDAAARLKFKLVDGQELIVTGSVKVYAVRGRYQLYATRIEPVGQGALELAFQQLKAKLDAEGLFSPDRKRPILAYPARIALLTSRSTAALQDMLKVLRRFPWLRLFVYHVPVQGDGSAEKIAAALDHLSQRHAQVGGVDVVLLARGGGSLEDLWEFNEEIVSRAVARCAIPVVTGIGHEVDCSIADLVADHHAHTPTEAAQVVTALWRVAAEAVDTSAARLRRGMRSRLQDAQYRLAAVERHEVFRRPTDRINGLRQLLDDREQLLALRVAGRLRALRRALETFDVRLQRHRPESMIGRCREKLAAIDRRLTAAAKDGLRRATARVDAVAADLRERHPRHLLALHRQQVESAAARLDRFVRLERRRTAQHLDDLAARLEAVSPENVLRRGYSITTLKRTGALVRSAGALRAGEKIVTRVADGEVESVVEDRKQPKLFE